MYSVKTQYNLCGWRYWSERLENFLKYGSIQQIGIAQFRNRTAVLSTLDLLIY